MPDEPPWTVNAVNARIQNRLIQLGINSNQIHGSYKKGWRHNGPSIRILSQIAQSLNWTLPEILGINMKQPPQFFSDLDPLIEGLLKHLPPPGTPWKHRKLWLQTLENSLNLIYPEVPDGTKNEREQGGSETRDGTEVSPE